MMRIMLCKVAIGFQKEIVCVLGRKRVRQIHQRISMTTSKSQRERERERRTQIDESIECCLMLFAVFRYFTYLSFDFEQSKWNLWILSQSNYGIISELAFCLACLYIYRRSKANKSIVDNR